MKILSWNCNGAFRRKYDALERFDADIFVIQECENPLFSNDKNYVAFAQNHMWVGENKNRGLGIFAKPNISIEKLNWSNVYEDHEVKNFLPVLINAKQQLVGVWTHYNNSPTFGYIGQLWKFLQINSAQIHNTIFIGDFNSNVIWDSWDRWWNHSDVVRILNSINIESAYHKYFDEEDGKETQKTFFLHRNEQKAYHIDYCFLPKALMKKPMKVEVEKFSDWCGISDHVPIVVTML